MTRPVIIGARGDEHVDAVVAALNERGPEAVVLDVARLESSSYRFGRGGLELGESRAVAVAADGGARGWIRRLAPEGWREDATVRSHEGVVRAAWYQLLAAVVTGLGVEWLTPLERLANAENKALQQLVAARLGIATPQTVIVSDRALIPPELGDELVVKPLGPGSFADAEGMRVVYANAVSRDDDALDALGAAPFLVQERIVAKRHLRIVTVVDQAWVCALDASAFPLDWRRADEAHDAFAPSTAFGDVAVDAVRLARALAVGYSSQDWLVNDDGYFFVDLNPGGQWLFLPRDVAEAVTAAIATWLCR